MAGRLEGRVAIVTGAGQGIGLAYAHRFLAEGAKVVVAELDEARGASAMEALAGAGEVEFVRTDIADPDSAQACVDATVARFGTVLNPGYRGLHLADLTARFHAQGFTGPFWDATRP